jgi:hypothetical protein
MIFELAWNWHEDYVPYLFSHDSKTKEEFNSDVKALLKKYGNEYIDQETSWVGAPGWIEHVVKKLPELGYIRIIPEQFSVFGAYIIECKEHDEDDFAFGDIVGEDLLKKAVEHNKKMEQEHVNYPRINSRACA